MERAERIGWVDVAKGFAMVFVYLGHWSTARVTTLAYSFHLQLFFIIAGFFCIQPQKKLTRFTREKVCAIAVPMLMWGCISFVISRLDAETFEISELAVLVQNPASIQPNYWFFPAMFSAILLGIFWVTHLLFGENPVIPERYNAILKFSQLPGIKIVNNWFSLGGAAQYLFWYALGALVYDYLNKYASLRKIHPIHFHTCGLLATVTSLILFLGKVTEIGNISHIIYSNIVILEFYRTITTIIICFGVIYLSILLERSSFLSGIGRNGVSLMGLEFITHSFIPLSLLPMLNMGIPSIASTVDVITITLATLWLNCRIARDIDRYFPVLNGRWRVKEHHSHTETGLKG